MLGDYGWGDGNAVGVCADPDAAVRDEVGVGDERCEEPSVEEEEEVGVEAEVFDGDVSGGGDEEAREEDGEAKGEQGCDSCYDGAGVEDICWVDEDRIGGEGIEEVLDLGCGKRG